MAESVWRVATTQRQTLGTAFGVAHRLAITCHHVIDGYPPESLRLSLDDRVVEVVAIYCPPELADLDIALLDLKGEVDLFACFAAAADGLKSRKVRLAGYALENAGVRAALHAIGCEIAGPTAVEYARRRRYAQTGVLSFKGLDFFGSGMSGAPLVDEQTGVAVGIVNSGLPKSQTFATPFALVKERRFVEALALNEPQPRYGRYINAQGVENLAGAQLTATLGRMRDAGILDDRFVPRSRLETSWRQFLSSSQPLVLTGRAGDGKTSYLAHLLKRPGVPAFLFRAAEFAPGRSVVEWTNTMLAAAAATAGFAAATLADLEGSKAQAILAIDGVNEAPTAIEPFLRAILSLHRNNLRVVITIRSHHWARFASLVTGRHEVIHIGGFEPSERAEACVAYGLPSDFGEGRSWAAYPLILKFAASARGLAVNDNYMQIAAGYIRHAAARAANEVGAEISVEAVEERLDALARLLLKAGGDSGGVLDGAMVRDAVGSPELLRALCAQEILEATGIGYRFVFDLVAAFCMTRATEWRQIRPELESEESSAFVLAQQLESRRPEVVRQALVQLIERASARDELISPVVDWLRRQPSARPFFDEIMSYGARLSTFGTTLGPGVLTLFVFESDLSVSEKLRFYRLNLAAESSYLWRRKSRNDLRREAREPQTLANELHSLVAAHPQEALPIIGTWLGDSTRLRDSEADVNEVAEALFEHAAACHGLAVFEHALDSSSDPATLVGHLARFSPRAAVEFAAEQHDLSNLNVVLAVLSSEIRHVAGVRAAWLKLVRSIAAVPLSGNARARSIALLLELEVVPEETWNWINELNPIDSMPLLYVLARRAHPREPRALMAMERIVEGVAPADVDNWVAALGTVPPPQLDELAPTLVRLLRLARARECTSRQIGYTLGVWLGHSPNNLFQQLGLEMVDADSDTRRTLLSSVAWSGGHGFRSLLLPRLLEVADGDELADFIGTVADSANGDSESMGFLEEAVTRIPPRGWPEATRSLLRLLPKVAAVPSARSRLIDHFSTWPRVPPALVAELRESPEELLASSLSLMEMLRKYVAW